MSLLTTLRKDKMQALKDKDTVKNGICKLTDLSDCAGREGSRSAVKRGRRTGLRSERAETDEGYVSADTGQPSGIDRRNAA